jgi:hypothetical protein
MNNETKRQAHKQWDKPQLIVLVRSKPEEAVLTACKPVGATGPNTNYSNCVNYDCTYVCEAEVGS